MDEKLQEALNQAAAESLRADEAEKEVKELKSRAEKAEGELRAMTTKHDKLVAERADMADADKIQRQLQATQTLLSKEKKRADAAEDPKRIRELVKARVALEAKAASVLGDDIRLDDMTDRQVMVAVIERLDSAVDDDATDAYIKGCFSTLVKGHAAGHAAIERINSIVAERVDEQERKERNDNRSARERFIESQNNVWKEAK